MRAENRSLAQRPLDRRIADAAPGAHANGPLGAGIVLGLNGAEPAHHIDRLSEGGCEEVLMRQSTVGDVHARGASAGHRLDASPGETDEQECPVDAPRVDA